MIGDKLASGAPSATFTGPRIHFNEEEMRQDLRRLPTAAFREKYWVTQNEYDMLQQSDGETTNMLLKVMHEEMEVIERLAAQDKAEDEGLERECFIDPFITGSAFGRVIVSRDQPKLRREQSKLALPRHLRKERERLPTTGHIIKAKVFCDGKDASSQFVGKRILFGPMSGQAICFRGYPTWIALDLNEIIGIVQQEDAEILEEELEPLA